jgi:hypothetical protein
MERADWMNDQLRDEIETLRRTHGFEEEEALAFWYLQQAAKHMHALRQEDITQEMDRHEGRLDQLALQHAIVVEHVSKWHSGIRQHFTALQDALGARVLRRAFPEGWSLLRREGMDIDED